MAEWLRCRIAHLCDIPDLLRVLPRKKVPQDAKINAETETSKEVPELSYDP